MTDREQIHISVHTDQKDRWTDHVEEEAEYSTLSHLIRRSVEKEINNEQTSTGSFEIVSEQSGFAQHFDDIHAKLDSFEEELNIIKEQTRSDPELEKLATEVLAVLPDERPGSSDWGEKNKVQITAIVGEEGDRKEINAGEAWDGTVDGIAEALDEKPWNVRQAIEKLQRDTYSVRTVDFDGETRYYRDE